MRRLRSDSGDSLRLASLGKFEADVHPRESVGFVVNGISKGTSRVFVAAQSAPELLADADLRDDVPVVDERPAFERANPLAYHFANGGHCDAEGHRVAAAALAQFLAPHM